MLPVTANYSVWPGVVPAGVPTEMTVAPMERAFIPADGDEYTVTVIPVNGDEPDYYHPSRSVTLTCRALDGVIRFRHAFPEEQEHLVLLDRDGARLMTTQVYSLKRDLYPLIPLRGDLHSHSYRSDGRRDPAALAGHYREHGYDFFALTDHNRYYPGGEIDETYAGVDAGLLRIPGEEVHAPGSPVHIVHVGGSRSVADEYVHDREKYEADAALYERNVPDHVPPAFRARYARAAWATDRIHASGGIAIFPHPFWKPGRSQMRNVREDYARLLLKSGMFDAFELVGGMQQPDINICLALWGDLRAEGLNIPVVGSSDVHSLDASEVFPHRFTIAFAADSTVDAVMAAVRSGMCVAVEATGSDYARQYRAYGSCRLVSYAQFLLKRFFPARERLTQGAGVAMRAFAMEAACPELIALHSRLAEEHRGLFFGGIPARTPSAAVISFENRWRATQLSGPLTKGSVVDAPPVTRQI